MVANSPTTALVGTSDVQPGSSPDRVLPMLEAAQTGPSDAAQGSYPSTVAADKPLAYYELNDSGSALRDSSGHGFSGTYGSHVHRDVATITTAASVAAAFPGGSSYDPSGYAFTPVNRTLQPGQITVEAWFKLSAANTTSHDLPIVVYGTAAHGVRYGLYLHGLTAGNNSLLYVQNNVGKAQFEALGGTRLVVGPIYHVVATFDGTTVTTYINGNLETRASNPGSINYSSVSNGVQIGGAQQIPQYASASFPGTIAQVAIYGYALSASRIVSHFLAGQLVPMTTERAAWSDAFVNSIGVNAHFDNSGSTYARQFTQVKSLLVNLGIRHLREAMTMTEPWYLNDMKELAASGVYGSYLVSDNLTKSDVQKFPSMVGSSFEQFEGINEPDIDHNPNWVAQTRSFQQNLYNWVKGDSTIARFPVLGPALTSEDSCRALGNISAYEDAGNIHDYFGVFNPGTGGWGGYYPPYGVYGSIAYNMNLGRIQSGTKPIVATETGYGTIAGDPLALDYRTHLRYMTRLFFEQFNAGIARTYPYELLDEGGSNIFNNFGLIQANLQPKPAYYGIRSIIGALKDPGSTYYPSTLTYRLTGFVDNVQHTLMQRRNGTYVMAIWLEVPDWQTAHNAGGDIAVPNQTVTLTTANHFAAASYTTMAEDGAFTTASVGWNGTTATFSVSDKISLIELTP